MLASRPQEGKECQPVLASRTAPVFLTPGRRDAFESVKVVIAAARPV
jgi:hypothetical protein